MATIRRTVETLFSCQREYRDAEREIFFLAVIGPNAYKLLSSLVAPEKPGEKTFTDLVDVMTQHHSPPPSEIVQRYRFHTGFTKFTRFETVTSSY